MIHDLKAPKYSLWIPVCLCRVVYLMKYDLLAKQDDILDETNSWIWYHFALLLLQIYAGALHNMHLPSWMFCHQAHRFYLSAFWHRMRFLVLFFFLQSVTLDSLTFHGSWIAKMSVLKSCSSILQTSNRNYFQCVLKFHGFTVQSASFLLLSCP